MVPPPVDVTRQLNESQLRIIGLLAGGWSNARIAAELGMAPTTVKWHVSQILSKLELASRAEAGEWWRARHGVRRRLWREAAPGTTERAEPTKGRTGMTVPALHEGGLDGGFAVAGETLAIEEWQGSAPGELHVHHEHDIAWHVIDGVLHFRFADGEADVAAGSTLFLRAGTPHTYGYGDARYLVIGHPRLFELFRELRTARTGRPHTDWGAGPDADIYRKYESELLEPKSLTP
jgi:DNA-binding CsgD family transcriptional regulator/quercetin dioxygenase-like cupin family protein